MSSGEPIVLSVDLPTTPAGAYAAFTGRFAEWWPIATHSLSRRQATRCRFDATVGGTVGELAPDGTKHVWGQVEAIEPGRRIRFSWHPGREPESAQWIDVVFAPAAGGSRVTLTHGGWEALGEVGPLLRQEYVAGWRRVFGVVYAQFASAAG
ncbi:MAG: SRPBCC domain-containing protein [Steroidobacteraceae bacterium]